jgi:hypothetical protein
VMRVAGRTAAAGGDRSGAGARSAAGSDRAGPVANQDGAGVGAGLAGAAGTVGVRRPGPRSVGVDSREPADGGAGTGGNWRAVPIRPVELAGVSHDVSTRGRGAVSLIRDSRTACDRADSEAPDGGGGLGGVVHGLDDTRDGASATAAGLPAGSAVSSHGLA